MAEQINSKIIPNQPIIKGDGKAAKLGDRFEVLVLTHFAIKCAVDEEFRKKNPRITFNAKDHGDLDDIVILTDDQLFLVQLKHKADKGNITIKFDKYENTYNNIILPKYKQYVDDGLIKINVVVFSNAKVLTPKDMKKVKSNNNEICKFITGRGEIYQLENQNNTSDFYKNLYIFSEQNSAINNIEMLSKNFKIDLNKSQIKAIFDYFDRSVIGRTAPFMMDDICSILNECILKPAIIFSNNVKFSLNDSVINLFETIFQKNKLLVVTEKYKELFISLINRYLINNSKCKNIGYGKKIPHEDLDNLYKENDIRKCLPTKEGPHTFEDLSIALWQIGKCPIMIEYKIENQGQIDYSINKFMNKEREGPIVILHDENVYEIPKYAIKFEDLDLFENANTEMKNHLLEIVKINVGKKKRTLIDVIGKDNSSFKKMKPSILLSILDNSLTITNLTNTPEIYIPRTLETKLVTESIFNMPDILFVIHHDASKLDFEEFLVHQSKHRDVNVVNSKLSIMKTKSLCRQIISRKYCCALKFGENYKIYHQKGIEKDLEQYTEKIIIKENEILNNTNMLVKIISADAGMGKSYLMEFQHQAKCVEMGKLPLYFNLALTYREMNQLERNKKTFITYFAKHLAPDKNDEDQIKFLEAVVEHNINEKNLVLLLDGFDEAKLKCEVINYLSSLDLDVVVSTRTHKLNNLLLNCDCLDLSLLTFTTEDQKKFFQQSYKSDENDKLDEMIEVLKKNVEESLMGIPLQIKHVVDIFPTINDFSENKGEINILFLYEKFLEKHLNQSNESKKMYIKKFACVFLLNSTILERLSIKKDDLINTIKDFELDNKINFIITGFNEDKEPLFVHKTYAEYLCADYLANVTDNSEIYDELLKDEDLLKIKYFFDIILCKPCKLHLAFLTKNIQLTEKYLNDVNCLEQRDKIGRTFLHIVSTYGERHSTIYKNNDSNLLTIKKSKTEFTNSEEILDQILNALKKNNIRASKDSRDKSPFEHAMLARSFNCLELLLKYFNNSFSVGNSDNIEKQITELLFISAVYDYINIFNALQTTNKYCKVIKQDDFEKNVSSCHNLGEVENCSFINTCARHGSREIVKALLGKNLFKMNKPYYCGIRKNKLTALQTAIYMWEPHNENQSSLISMLMENGAKDVMYKNNDVYGSILHLFAIKIGYDSHNLIISVLPKFIKSHHQNYVNSRNNRKETPLMLAIEHVSHHNVNTYIEFIFDVLIRYQANLHHLNYKNRNIWHYLIENSSLNDENKIKIATKLISLFIDEIKNQIDIKENEDGETPLTIAIQRGKYDSEIDLINILIEHYINADKKNKIGLKIWYYLFMNWELNSINKIEIVSKIISLLGDANKYQIGKKDKHGRTPLMIAIQRAQYVSAIDLINILIEHSTDIDKKNKKGKNIWHNLITNWRLSVENKMKIARKIISLFGDEVKNQIDKENEDGETPLMIAIQKATSHRQIDLINILIEHSTNINKKNKKGENIWHYLIKNTILNSENKINIALKIITHYKYEITNKINEKDKYGQIPLMIAIRRAQYDTDLDFINWLIFYTKQHSLTIRNKKGQNVWHYLFMNCELNDENKIKLALKIYFLFGDGIKYINRKDIYGVTPSMMALQKTQYDSAVYLLHILIERTTNINKKYKTGQNIWHFLSINRTLRIEDKIKLALKLKSLFGDEIKNQIGQQDEDGETPLMIAIKEAEYDSEIDFIYILINNSSTIDKRNKKGKDIENYLLENKNLNYETKLRIRSKIISLFGDKIKFQNDEEYEKALIKCTAENVSVDSEKDLIQYLQDGNMDKKYKEGQICCICLSCVQPQRG